MAYTPPTVQSFLARYVEFTPVDPAYLQAVLDECVAQVEDNWVEDDRARAQELLTAHTLKMEGQPAASAGGGVAAGGTGRGDVTSITVGRVSVDFGAVGGAENANAVGAYDDAYYLRSVYGQRFLALMRSNFFPIAAV